MFFFLAAFFGFMGLLIWWSVRITIWLFILAVKVAIWTIGLIITGIVALAAYIRTRRTTKAG